MVGEATGRTCRRMKALASAVKVKNMIYTGLTKLAMKLCFERHRDQVDKSGIPHPFHPFHVAESMTDEKTTCVALMHDLLEDTATTGDELHALGFPEEKVLKIR